MANTRKDRVDEAFKILNGNYGWIGLFLDKDLPSYSSSGSRKYLDSKIRRISILRESATRENDRIGGIFRRADPNKVKDDTPYIRIEWALKNLLNEILDSFKAMNLNPNGDFTKEKIEENIRDTIAIIDRCAKVLRMYNYEVEEGDPRIRLRDFIEIFERNYELFRKTVFRKGDVDGYRSLKERDFGRLDSLSEEDLDKMRIFFRGKVQTWYGENRSKSIEELGRDELNRDTEEIGEVLEICLDILEK